MLELRDLDMRFAASPVLQGVTLAVQPGEFVAVLGASGCGKTTLLRIAAGALRPNDGTVSNRFRRSAFVFQDCRLAGWMTALQNAAFGLKAAGQPRRRREREAARILLRLGLEAADLAKRPHALSGGMRQRVGLARALAVAPDLLLLDEPFSALDIGLRRDMQHLVRAEVDQQGIAALLVTHDIAEAVRLADRIVVLSPRPATIVAEIVNRPSDDEALIFETAARLLRRPGVEEALLRRSPQAREPDLPSRHVVARLTRTIRSGVAEPARSNHTARGPGSCLPRP
jgi:NitT/TauT family transport system ATP-binding protein